MNNAPLYLDYNATTPVDPRVVKAMLPYLEAHFGNPSSSHAYGRKAKEAVDAARADTAALIGAQPHEIVFTGCATEANNLAIQGVASALDGKRRHLITTAIEHPSVLQPFLHLEREGWEITVLPVNRAGRVNAEEVGKALRPDTALVSVMHANNETGAVQPVAEIAALVRPQGVLLHCDAAQSAGKIPVSVDELGADLLTLAGHKFYAPKGVGALYVRSGTPLEPIMVGAGHEWGLRPGTESVPLLVGFGAAARLAREMVAAESTRLNSLRDLLHAQLVLEVPDLSLNGPVAHRLPNTLNVSFPGVDGWALVEEAGLAASTGSACHAGNHAGSPVLAAMGVTPERAAGAVRLSIGRFTMTNEIERATDALVAAWRKLHR